MAGQGPAEVHTATIPVDHSQFTIFDVFGDDTYADLDIPRDPAWLVTAGRSGALFHTSDRALSAEVTLEVWADAPETQTATADAADHVFHTANGRVMIACITASPSDQNVALPGPGDYHLRARRLTSRNIAEEGDPDFFQEVWQVQIWPRT
ncbi:hypothetical protein Amsp01_050120 [Amycolatopsis sp. NBRC 101858]|uniref:hypothetical protein n=1 Tax=Amycolatopsis sp. NBRC 101858 TaxID=3032200 RepID=UPI0024A1A9A4|nr:hypothetical protein [Amycolatopsis sp. NBRC 101858]GLY38988.1 hypothetical protein Amsp01_050120 [Amycolatopsis sp. NBRC 101858]